MVGRVIVGKNGSNYGLWVSKPSTEVTTATDKDMLFATSSPSMGQMLLFQRIDVAANASTTLDYKNHGGVKTVHFFWEVNVNFNQGGSYDGYLTGTSLLSSVLSVTNTYINTTTNRITVVNVHPTLAKSVIAGVWKEAAA